MLNQYKIPEVISRDQKLQQIKSWVGSETDKSSAEYHSPKKIKFPHNVSLIAACYANDKEEFKRILKLGIDINCRNQDGMACVHQCCINGDYDFLNFLISEGADVNVQDNEGWTPLHAAASIGCKEMVQLLLENDADPSLFSCEMELPVDVTQSQEVIDLLNESMQAKGIDPVAARQSEETLLLTHAKHWAQTGNYSPHIDPRTGATPLHVAACKDYIAVLEVLLGIPGIPLDVQDKDGWTALHAAAHWSREQPARMLAEAGASFDVYTHANQSVFDLADRDFVVLLRQLRAKQRANPRTVPDVKPVGADTAVAEETAASPSLLSTRDVDPSPSTSPGGADSPASPEPTATTTKVNAAEPYASQSSDNETSEEESCIVIQPDKPCDTVEQSAKPVGDDVKAAGKAGKQQQQLLQQQDDGMSSTDSLRSSSTPSAASQASPHKPTPAVGDQLTDNRSTAAAGQPAKRSSHTGQPEPLEIMVPRLSKPNQPPTPPAATDVSQARAGDRPLTMISVNGDRQTGDRLATSETTRNGPLPSPPIASPPSADTITATKATIRTNLVDTGKASSGKSGEEDADATTSANSSISTKADKPYQSRLVRKRTPPSNNIPELAQGSLAIPDISEISRQDALHRQTNASSIAVDDRSDSQPTCRRTSLVCPMAKTDVTETQRSVKARYVRSTRRSTQGVSAEELEEAMRLSGIPASPSPADSATVGKNNNAAAVSASNNTRGEHQHATDNVIFIGASQPQTGQAGYRSRPEGGRAADRQTVRVSRTAARQPRPSPSLSITGGDSQKVPMQYMVINSNSKRDRQPVKLTGSPQTQRWTAPDEADSRLPHADDHWRPSGGSSTHRLTGSQLNSLPHAKDTAVTTASNTHVTSVDSPRMSQRGMETPSVRQSHRQAAGDTLASGTQVKSTSTSAGNLTTSNGSVIPRPSTRFLQNSDSLAQPPHQQHQQSDQSLSKSLYSRPTSTTSSTPPTTVVASFSAPLVLPPVTSRYSSGNSLATSDSEQYSTRSLQRDRGFDAKVDYRRLYEEERRHKERLTFELDRLKREVARLRVDMSRSNSENLMSSRSASPVPASNSSDNQASVDEELTRLREENHRIREENGALIRVISKLSHPA